MATCSSVNCRIAIVAAMEREVGALVKNWRRIHRQYEGRTYSFFESGDAVCVCGGIGLEAARRATEAAITLYHPQLIFSVGFAVALDPTLRVGEIFTPATIIDARDGSRTRLEDAQLEEGRGTLLTFPHVAGVAQKQKLLSSYAAQAVDMEAAAVAVAAEKHSVAFAAVKAISDEANFEIPGSECFIDHEGRFHTGRFILFGLPRPWLWPRIAKLAANSRKAATALAEYLKQVLSNPEITRPTTLTARRHN